MPGCDFSPLIAVHGWMANPNSLVEVIADGDDGLGSRLLRESFEVASASDERYKHQEKQAMI